MKNKKLFAILTLVCFMFTLMPVAAFAAPADDTQAAYTAFVADPTEAKFAALKTAYAAGNVATDLTKDTADIITAMVAAETAAEAAAIQAAAVATATEWAAFETANGDTGFATLAAAYAASEGLGIPQGDTAVAAAVVATGDATKANALYDAYDNGAVAYNPKSNVATVKQGLELDKNEYGKAVVTLKSSTDMPVAGDAYVWAEAVANEISAAFVASGTGVSNASLPAGVYKVDVAANGTTTFDIAFTTAGTYTLKAVVVADNATAPDFATIGVEDMDQITSQAGYNTIKVNSPAVDTKQFVMSVATVDAADVRTTVDAVVNNGEETDTAIDVAADGVSTADVVVGFTYYGNVMPGQEVSITTNSSSIDVDTAKAYTNWRGEVEFAISGAIEGNYLVTVKTGNFSADINVTVGSTAASDIELIDEPTAPIALDVDTADFSEEIEFEITDVNGNLVYSNGATFGVFNAGTVNPAATSDAAKYVSFIEKPEGSKLANKNIWIENDGDHWNLVLNKSFDKEGTYSVKVVLDNGRSAVATWEVKEFQTPVEIVIDAPKSVELGTTFVVDMDYVDVNGVTKPVDSKTDLAATGYAIANFGGNAVTVKTDEKYAGSTITLTAVSQKYALVSTATVAVAAEAVAIEFEDAAVETNVNNKIEWNVVDSEGNAVELTNVAGATIRYVVLDKPEDAKVSVVDRTVEATFDGDGEMSLTSNKVGNVAVQVIAQVRFGNSAELTTEAQQTKYYTGTQIFAVGNGQVGDVVVMSIGSNEIVINDAKAAIDAAPIVENNRTFVPFRALAEAFGATVAYDEATQAVTAELNGVTVVMTIGSAEYTVNGEAKTADVAPFINGSRTMVPVRFVAEAFGIKVIPTYDENGATADILFNL